MTIILLIIASELIATGIALFILIHKVFELQDNQLNSDEYINELQDLLLDQRKINKISEDKFRNLNAKIKRLEREVSCH